MFNLFFARFKHFLTLYNKYTLAKSYMELERRILISCKFLGWLWPCSPWIYVQVQFKEGILQPPEIKSRLDLPENIDIFGQKVNLSPVQQTLDPVQQTVASLFQVISGQPPLKIPIPGDRNKSWLLITYLDEDLRISRGDGGLFVLVKEGSALLDQWKSGTFCRRVWHVIAYIF